MAEYKEELSTGGFLIVTEKRWYIYYNFPGPDRRFNWSFFEIDGLKVPAYIEALKENFEIYLKLKQTVPEQSYYNVTRSFGMEISVEPDLLNLKCGGLRICNGHKVIKTKEQLDAYIKDLEYCKNRARQIHNDILDVYKPIHTAINNRVSKLSVDPRFAKKCRACGNLIRKDSKICDVCGKKQGINLLGNKKFETFFIFSPCIVLFIVIIFVVYLFASAYIPLFFK